MYEDFVDTYGMTVAHATDFETVVVLRSLGKINNEQADDKLREELMWSYYRDEYDAYCCCYCGYRAVCQRFGIKPIDLWEDYEV